MVEIYEYNNNECEICTRLKREVREIVGKESRVGVAMCVECLVELFNEWEKI